MKSQKPPDVSGFIADFFRDRTLISVITHNYLRVDTDSKEMKKVKIKIFNLRTFGITLA
jgi:hypothetical protein